MKDARADTSVDVCIVIIISSSKIITGSDEGINRSSESVSVNAASFADGSTIAREWSRR